MAELAGPGRYAGLLPMFGPRDFDDNHSDGKERFFPLPSGRLDDQDAGVVYLEAHEVRTDHHAPIVGLTCRSQQFFRCREWNAFLRKA